MNTYSTREYWAAFKQSRERHLNTNMNPEFCEKMVELSKKYFTDLCLIGQELYKDKIYTHDIFMKLDWGRNRKTSRGGFKNGKGYVTMAMVRATMPFPVIEYPSINYDREIGYLATQSSEIHLACTLAHELAHAFHFLMRKTALIEPHRFSDRERKSILSGPHGDCWKAIYRAFRVHYVNKMTAGV